MPPPAQSIQATPALASALVLPSLIPYGLPTRTIGHLAPCYSQTIKSVKFGAIKKPLKAAIYKGFVKLGETR